LIPANLERLTSKHWAGDMGIALPQLLYPMTLIGRGAQVLAFTPRTRLVITEVNSTKVESVASRLPVSNSEDFFVNG
jgi:hypothetical protein